MAGLRRRLWARGLGVALLTVMVAAWAVATERGAQSASPAPATASAAPAGTSAAVPPSVSTIGVLSPAGELQAHSCTAAVVTSSSGEVIVTAAHCVAGTGAGLVFAPGYQAGTAPYGTWVVQHAYVSAGWLDNQNPEDDVAFLTVSAAAANPSAATVQAVVGGYSLASAPGADDQVRVSGYVAGDDVAVSCTADVYLTGAYPSFDCAGFAGGTSGGPWITNGATGTPVLAAVIGGLHQGGCSPDTSYSAPFTAATAAILARAAQDQAADILPSPNSDGC
ncbi:MAG: hypothetical protein QOE71_234 [Pseudonocardiales bacterium]|nr:hypothetical protein [Pseudonocardiales bacterium]